MPKVQVNQEKAPTGLYDLPYDAHLHITQFLTVNERVKGFCLTCKRFQTKLLCPKGVVNLLDLGFPWRNWQTDTEQQYIEKINLREKEKFSNKIHIKFFPHNSSVFKH